MILVALLQVLTPLDTPEPPPLPVAVAPPPAIEPAPVAAPAPPECNTDDEDGTWVMDRQGCRTKKKRRIWEGGTVVGGRVGVTNVSGSEADGTFVGATLALNVEQFDAHRDQIYSGHISLEGSLGGGSGGIEGSLGGLFAFGVRAPFGHDHGPVARIGIAGELIGNRRFYYSHLDLPVAEVGYQFAPRGLTLELGARGGSDLTGRYDTGHRTRRELGDGSFLWGIYAAEHGSFGRLDISFTRFEADKNYPGGGVDVLRGLGCIYFMRKLAACADGMVLDGKAYSGPPGMPREVRSVYAGVTIGSVDL